MLRAAFLILALGAATGSEARTICTIVADETGRVVLEEGDCASRATPASTFKIALAVMGFDSGFLQDAETPKLNFKAGDPDWGGEDWRQDTTPSRWIKYSVVWYSQRITRALGAARLTDYAQAMGYGNADFSGDAGVDNGLERAWISSSLQISPREQVGFLQRLLMEELPVSARAMAQARGIVESSELGGWQIWGKTGSAYPRHADRSFDRTHGWGWYVGWAERAGKRVIFARLTQAEGASKTSTGIATRRGVLADWAELMEKAGR
jgi:beta-lactamase class D